MLAGRRISILAWSRHRQYEPSSAIPNPDLSLFSPADWGCRLRVPLVFKLACSAHAEVPPDAKACFDWFITRSFPDVKEAK